MSYVFGPVPSRRLGRSLGVDLVPFKTCTYDCIYCQLGRTTNKTPERTEWVPVDDVVEEGKQKLPTRPDYITLSGSGEFVLAGYTAIPAEAQKLAECVRRIRPDRVQLNTVTRPPAEEYALAVDRRRLEELAGLFDPPAEVVADFRGVHARPEFAASRQTVLEMIRRRPCSIDDIAQGLGMHRNEAVKYVEELSGAGLLERRRSVGRVYFTAPKGKCDGGA